MPNLGQVDLEKIIGSKVVETAIMQEKARWFISVIDDLVKGATLPSQVEVDMSTPGQEKVTINPVTPAMQATAQFREEAIKFYQEHLLSKQQPPPDTPPPAPPSEPEKQS